MKKTFATAAVAAAAAGVLLTGAPAHASDGAHTSGDGSVLGGTQTQIPVAVNTSICGNSIPIVGVANAFCKGNAKAYQN
ncbi:chaplin family protein [Nocardiopsis rhodophaea]